MYRVLTAAFLLAISVAAPAADKVTAMPGWGDFSKQFDMYSGYVTTNDPKHHMHYIFVSSQAKGDKDPVVVWMNGGPGCSSMNGFSQEHGPYVIDDGETEFKYNDYSWNLKHNMLYIDQPAYVGYSYCEDTKNCNFNDNTTANETAHALVNWMKAFPEYKDRDFYVSGESYGGIYVPLISKFIDEMNVNSTKAGNGTLINLAGYMVGNGVTNDTYDNQNAFMRMAFWHGLYSEEMHENITALGCDWNKQSGFEGACGEIYTHVNTVLAANINPYDVFRTCWHGQLACGTKSSETPVESVAIKPLDHIRAVLKNDPNAAGIPCVYTNPMVNYFE